MKIRQTGFTTMELLTTMVVAGVITAIAIPSFSRMAANNRVIEQTNDLVAALNYGRSEAIRRNAPITFCRAATADATACATASANWQHWIVRNGLGTVLRRGSLSTHGGTQQVSSNLTNESIVFTPDGLAWTGGALVGGTVEADGDDSAEHTLTVCSSKATNENIRVLTLGSSSRIVTTRETGPCT